MARPITRTMRVLFRALRPKRKAARALPGLLRSLFTATDAALNASTHESPARSRRYSLRAVQRRVERAQGRFIESSYRNRFGTRRYKLFLPPAHRESSAPLIVMLHGCSQGPDEFARATAMNELGAERSFAVAYPAQSASANRSKCWNWFRRSDQQRGRGEPAILAGLTRHLIKAYGFDRERVYVAGLSAGAAMAVVLGHTYPELFAAIGVHSGLPYAAAHDVTSAFAAMRGECVGRTDASNGARRIPTIAIHGDRDRIVHPSNLQRLFDQFIDGHDPVAWSTERVQIDGLSGDRSCTQTTLRDASGIAVFEHWLVHGGGHAWFGGEPGVRHADPAGPNASVEMLRFFSAHRLPDTRQPIM